MSLIRRRSGSCTFAPIHPIPFAQSPAHVPHTPVITPPTTPVYLSTAPAVAGKPGKVVSFVDRIWSIVSIAVSWFCGLLPLITWLQISGLTLGGISLVFIYTAGKAGSDEIFNVAQEVGRHAVRSTVNADTLGLNTLGRSIATVQCYFVGNLCDSSYATYTDAQTGDQTFGTPFWRNILGQDRSLVFTEGLGRAAVEMASRDMVNLATMSHRQVSSDVSALRELAASSSIGSSELERTFTRSELKKVASLSEGVIKSSIQVAADADMTLRSFKTHLHNFILDCQANPEPSPAKVRRAQGILDQLYDNLGYIIVGIDKVLAGMSMVDVAYDQFKGSLDAIKASFDTQYHEYPMWMIVLERSAQLLRSELVLGKLGDITLVSHNITKARRALHTMGEIATGLRATRDRMVDLHQRIGYIRRNLVSERAQIRDLAKPMELYRPLLAAWKDLDTTCREANTIRNSPDILKAVLANQWWPF